jgi:glycosyltransferase involved in cell wall biosynthesis
MDVSVCIPVFNSDVKKLVAALAEQIVHNQLSAEIVVLDDASSIEMESKIVLRWKG